MDPTENLQHQRRIMEQIRACEDRGHKPQWCACKSNAATLADLVEALDGWIMRGGFLPAPWKR